MKKLEDLGIDPTPWKCICYIEHKGGDAEDLHLGEVKFSDRRKLCYDISQPTAHIISASPDMYEALWDLLFGDNGTANCRKCKGAELGNCKTCHLGKARFALEKAEGEVVAK